MSPHMKTQTHRTIHNNFPTEYKINPYTVISGGRALDYSSGALNYGSVRIIFQKLGGGQCYNNGCGDKAYVL